MATVGTIHSRGSIKILAQELIQEYVSQKGWRFLDELKLDLQDIYETVLYPRFEYELITSADLGFLEARKILGKTIPKERVVLVDQSISLPNIDPRYAFTLAHEFGHSILHSDCEKLFRCTTGGIFGPGQNDRKEVQANFFSENFLMPDSFVYAKFRECYRPCARLRYVGKSKYWFAEFGVKTASMIDSYRGFCTRLARPLTRFFSDVSRTSLGLKIHRLGLVDNFTRESFIEDPMRLGDVLNRLRV